MQKSIKINTVLNMIKTLAAIIFPLITFPYVSRVLKPDNIGKINFVNSIINYFSLLATLGVTTYAVRECSRVREKKAELERTSSEIISLNICTMIVSLTILTVCSVCIPKFKEYQFLLFIKSITIIFTVLGADWLNTAMEDFKYLTIRSVAFQILSLILLLIFVKNQDDYIKYMCIIVLGESGGNICNIFYRKKYCTVHITKCINWKKHFPPIIMLFSLMVSQTILNSIDTTMLGFMKGNYEVGLYSTAVKIILTITQVISSVCWVVMPQLSQAFAISDYGCINIILKRVVSFSITLTLPCVVGVMIIPKNIMCLIGGEQYIKAATCLKILALSMFINVIAGILGNMILLPAQREKQFTLACIAGMLINVIMNAALIPKYGINGAAVATVASSGMILLGTLLKFDKNIQFSGIFSILKGPIIGTIIIVLIGETIKYLCLPFGIETIAIILISTVAYIIVLLYCRNEFLLEIVKPIFGKIKNKKF